ncbi:MAG: c-type cytochrome [Methyloceanibacter sp.]
MKSIPVNRMAKVALGLLAVFALGVLTIGSIPRISQAAEEVCCEAGDMTPPDELVKKVPPGQLHSPYPDYAKLAKEEELVKQYRLPGCNECHGGNGGGGICPALTQGVWFWGNTDDVLFRLIALGSVELEKQGFVRYQYGSVHAPMPPMGFTIKTTDQMWKIIAFIRSINPPGTNPPEKIIPGRMAPAGESK